MVLIFFWPNATWGVFPLKISTCVHVFPVDIFDKVYMLFGQKSTAEWLEIKMT